MSDWLQLLGGGLLLYAGAEWFVGGASSLALSLRIPQILVGLTIVAYGTSAPEAIVGVQAALSGHGEVALGNVIGSNIANVGLILGSAALIRPARVDATLRARELPVMVVSALAVPLLLIDGSVNRVEAVGLLLCAALYAAWMFRSARRTTAQFGQAAMSAQTTSEAADLAGAPSRSGRRSARAAASAAIGLLVLLIGGKLFIGGAVSVAHMLGISERLVGLTIVAMGTSLPELVTSAIAARRGHSDIAVGNVVGSNISNVFLCLGAAALVGSVSEPLRELWFELAAMIGMTLLAALFIRTERTITRAEGGVAVACYLVFTFVTVGRG